ncbi:MAG: cytochrome c [Ahrensia sp.]|nr:cytochrome c [Ahrensia sp.]
MRKMWLGVSLAAIAAVIGIGGTVLAHSGATGIVKQRMDSMKAIGASMKAISKLDWNDEQTARQSLQTNASAIGMHASHIVDMFPEGSIQGPSEAEPAIWSRAEDFARIADALEQRADELAQMAPTASSASDIKPLMGLIGDTCKACHQDFRKKNQ